MQVLIFSWEIFGSFLNFLFKYLFRLSFTYYLFCNLFSTGDTEESINVHLWSQLLNQQFFLHIFILKCKLPLLWKYKNLCHPTQPQDEELFFLVNFFSLKANTWFDIFLNHLNIPFQFHLLEYSHVIE